MEIKNFMNYLEGGIKKITPLRQFSPEKSLNMAQSHSHLNKIKRNESSVKKREIQNSNKKLKLSDQK
jgi:hypothetical protein